MTWMALAQQMSAAGFPPGDVLILTALVVQVAALRRVVKSHARRLTSIESALGDGKEEAHAPH